MDAHVALLTTCTYTLLLVAVKAAVLNVVAVVLGAPCDVPGGVVPDVLVTNHWYVGAGVEPEPLTTAVKVTELFAQMLVTFGLILTAMVGTGVTVTLTGVDVAVADVTHVKVLFTVTLTEFPAANAVVEYVAPVPAAVGVPLHVYVGVPPLVDVAV